MGLFSSDEETIKGVGSYEYDDKNLSCDFNISSDEFFNRFSDVTGDLPSGAIEDIRKAIDSGREVKISRKYRRDVGSFFDRVETASKSGPAPSAGDSSTTMGFDEEEADEAAEAEEMKKEGATSDQLYYEDQDTSTEGIDTYDEDTGEREGEIILGEEGATGDLVPLEIKESVKAEYEHNAEEPK